jgi:hypothetical protein
MLNSNAKGFQKSLFPKSLASPAIRLLLNTGDTMANASLGSLIFTSAAADPEPSRNAWAQNGNLSAGASQDDALLISSDDESDYGYLDEDQSDTFPSIGELSLRVRREDVRSSSITGNTSRSLPSRSCRTLAALMERWRDDTEQYFSCPTMPYCLCYVPLFFRFHLSSPM